MVSEAIRVRGVRAPLGNQAEIRKLFSSAFPGMGPSALQEVISGVCFKDKTGLLKAFQGYSSEIRQETWITSDHKDAMAITIANIDEDTAIKIRSAHASLGKSAPFNVDAVAAMISNVVGGGSAGLI